VVGGISSVGKTTFVHQLADQFAGAGDHVLYFSLEQSKLEMVSKSLARITAKNDYSQAVSSISIRGGYTPPQVIKAVKDYQDTAKRVSVIEGNFSTNVVQIKGYITDYMRRNPGVKPIVMIDYLQIIPGEVKLGDKQRIDNTVTELKRISRDLDLIMFVISSLNRGNYLAPVDFESFKESGGIEYTADVIWGLQLAVINEPLFDKDSNVKAKRTKVKEAKAADPRLIELVCLKNRNGKPSFSCWFNYYPKFDLFVDQNELSWEGVTSKRL
jgi:replicative DNA helicase